MRKHGTKLHHLGWVAAGLLAAAPAFASDDSEFVEKAASGGMMEVKLGEYASQTATSPAVRAFGQHMVEDHAKANEELKAVAQKNGIMLPAEMNAEHQAMTDRLTKMKGMDFDRAYMNAMVEDHEKDVKAFRSEAEDGKSDVDRWAAKIVPTLEKHLELARDVDRKLAGTTSSTPDTTGARTHPSGATGKTGTLDSQDMHDSNQTQ